VLVESHQYEDVRERQAKDADKPPTCGSREESGIELFQETVQLPPAPADQTT